MFPAAAFVLLVVLTVIFGLAFFRGRKIGISTVTLWSIPIRGLHVCLGFRASTAACSKAVA